MTLLPVVAREMHVLSRRKSTYWARAVTALLALFVTGWLLLLVLAQTTFAAFGKTIFQVLSSVGFAYALLAGIHSTSDCLSEEKREGTLGLLFLTDLKSYDIVLGKMAASSLNSIYALIGIFPMISLALLAGGVTLRDLGKVSLLLLNTMFLSLALGSFVSALSKNERRAMFASSVTLFLVTAAPFIIALSVTDFRTAGEKFVWFSPLYPILCVYLSSTTFNSAYLLTAMITHHLAAWLLLIGSWLILPAFLSEVPKPWFPSFRAALENHTFGRKEERGRYRAALLDQNAFLWLAARERVKAGYAWLIIALFGGLHLWLLSAYPSFFFDLAISGGILLVTHILLKVWVVSELSSRLVEDRRSGALELLLTSPLSVREIVKGQALALRRVFGKPVIFLVGSELILAVASYLSTYQRPPPFARAWTYVAAASTLPLDLWALRWVGLWLSISGKNIERVLIASVVRVLVLPSMAFLTIAWMSAIVLSLGGSSASYINYLVLAWGISVFASIVFGWTARSEFLGNFREMAAHRFDSALEGKTDGSIKAVRKRARPKSFRDFNGWLVRHWIITGTAAVLALCAGGLFLRRAYWKHQFDTQVRQVRAQGYPANTEETARLEPPLRPADNAIQALGKIGFIDQGSGGFVEWRAFRSVPIRHRISEDEEKAFQKAVRRYSTEVMAMRELRSYRDIRLNFGSAIYSNIAGALELVAMDLLLANENRESARVESDIAALIAYARIFGRSQPGFSAQALECLIGILPPVFDHETLAASELAGLAQQMDSLDIESLIPRLLSTRAYLLEMAGRQGLPVTAMAGGPALALAVEWLLNGIGTRYKQWNRCAALYEQAIQKAASPYPERLAWARRFERPPLAAPPGVLQDWDDLCAGSLAEMFLQEAAIKARVNVLKTAIAAQRQLQAVHYYPTTLEELVPKYISAVPVDPFSGQPIQCRLRKDFNYVVYSVGTDGIDNEGVAGADMVFAF